MPSIGPAIVSGNNIVSVRQQIHQFPFALVSPLPAKNNGKLGLEAIEAPRDRRHDIMDNRFKFNLRSI